MTMIVHLKRPHNRQQAIIDSPAPRKVVRAGRRGGKTTVAAILAVQRFLDGKRILYATPTQEQVDRFWHEVKLALAEPIDANVFYKNETMHIIELPGTEQRIRAKTAWNADTLRGDYADTLILDEYQQMGEDTWGLVGAPMLLDNDGDAIFIYTEKRGKHHSKELFNKAKEDTSGRWQTFVFSSHDNPYLSREALADITKDMTSLAYRAEILAEEIDDDPRALWKRELIQHVTRFPDLTRVVVGVDPPGSEDGAECGIVVAGSVMLADVLGIYVLGDYSLQGSPAKWASEVVSAYNRHHADRVVGERNYGGDMVENTIRGVDGGQAIAYKDVIASRGKALRAEPVVAQYEQGRVQHAGSFTQLEDEMCNWVPGMSKWSPNRIDALVWAITDLMTGASAKAKVLVADMEITYG